MKNLRDVPKDPAEGTTPAAGLVVAVALCLLAVAAPARADVNSGLLGPLQPGEPPSGSQKKFEEYAPHDDGTLLGGASSSGDLTTMNLERWQIATGSGYVTLRGERGRYVVGLGRNAWGMDVARNRSTAKWAWGYLTGGATNPVNKCLYAEFAYLDRAATGATRDCSTTGDLPPAGYMAAFNGNRDGVNCFYNDAGERKCDGTKIVIDRAKCPSGAPVYPNVQPWTANASRAAADYTIPPDSIVKWRYITKDYRHTMMRYEGAKPYAQDWGFIDAGCISNYGYYEWYTSA